MISIHTVGHANRSLEELVTLLQLAGAMTLVDIRQQPQSAGQPHFDQDSLRIALDAVGIEYHWAGRQLGDQRQPRADSPHAALKDVGLRSFADYMDTDTFKRGVAQLLGLANRASTTLLSMKVEPLHCHRSLIADYLTLQGIEVIHIIAPDRQHSHALRAEVRRESQQLIYDRQVTAQQALEAGRDAT